MTGELQAFVNWFGLMSGVLGVTIAIYLQLINPRPCSPEHVWALFVGGSALIMVFSAVWTDGYVLLTLKTIAILVFVTLELAGGYYVWKQAEAAPPREVLRSWYNNNGGKT